MISYSKQLTKLDFQNQQWIFRSRKTCILWFDSLYLQCSLFLFLPLSVEPSLAAKLPSAGDENREISVRCFACDLELKLERDALQPNAWWDEHISQSKSCPYVRLCRRDDVQDHTPGISLSMQKTIDLYPTMSTLQHRVEMREIRSRVDLPLYFELQRRGHSRDLLIYIVQRRLEVSLLKTSITYLFCFSSFSFHLKRLHRLVPRFNHVR